MSFYTDFAEYYERIFPFREETFAFLEAMVPGRAPSSGSGAATARARRVLDVGCGTGHYCGRFAALGLEAVGFDLDSAMIAAARERYPQARFECLDMRDLPSLAEGAERGFDLAFCIGNTLAHLPAAELPRFLAALHGLLVPGGRWLLQVVHWDRILAAGGIEFPVLRWEGEIAFHRAYRDLTEQRVRFVTRLVEGGVERFRGEVDLHPIREGGYEALHAAAGFTCVGRHGDFQGTPLGPSSAAMVLSFEK